MLPVADKVLPVVRVVEPQYITPGGLPGHETLKPPADTNII
jgi:hypothetical protein